MHASKVLLVGVIAASAAAGCGRNDGAEMNDVRRVGDGAAAPIEVALRPPCGQGTWRPGTFEIHHLDMGQADATFVIGPTGKTLLIDVGETLWTANRGAMRAGAYIETVMGCKRVDQVVVTHFHLDHIGYVGKGGLWHLVTQQGFEIGRFLHRDARTFLGDTSGTFGNWKKFLDGEGQTLLHPQIVKEGLGTIDMGPSVQVRVVAVDGAGRIKEGDFSAEKAPPNENDYSVVLLLRFGRLDYLIAGDLSGALSVNDFGYTYHDIETEVARRLPDVDVYRVNHHGSDHSSNATFMAQISPEVAIVSCGDGNSYGHPRPVTMQRLLARSAVYLTERGDMKTDIGTAKVGGNIVLRTTDGIAYTVNADPFVATDPVRIDEDMDGYFREADPDDRQLGLGPAANGGCNPKYQSCP